jgi:hypothetical protein
MRVTPWGAAAAALQPLLPLPQLGYMVSHMRDATSLSTLLMSTCFPDGHVMLGTTASSMCCSLSRSQRSTHKMCHSNVGAGYLPGNTGSNSVAKPRSNDSSLAGVSSCFGRGTQLLHAYLQAYHSLSERIGSQQ